MGVVKGVIQLLVFSINVSLVDLNESTDVCAQLWPVCWKHALMFMDEILGMDFQEQNR